MSTYTTRLIEAKITESKGFLDDDNVFPEGVQNGDIYTLPYNIRTDDKKYCKYVDGKWEYMADCPSHWILLKAYIPRGPKKPQKKVLVDEYDEHFKKTGRQVEQPVGMPDNNAYLFKDENGKDVWFKIEDDWSNNGGNVRDNYISTYGSNDNIKGRGLPDDLSDDAKKILTDEESDAKKYGYAFTWCSLAEWYRLYDEAEKEILKKLDNLYVKKHLQSSENKLNFIIKNLGKNPSDKERNKIIKYAGRPKDEDDFDFDEEMAYIIEEDLPVLWSIGYEIGRVEALTDMYDLYGSDSVRIIYYLS